MEQNQLLNCFVGPVYALTRGEAEPLLLFLSSSSCSTCPAVRARARAGVVLGDNQSPFKTIISPHQKVKSELEKKQ